MRVNRKKRIADESLSKVFNEVKEFLNDGLSGKAETILTETLENYSHTPDSRVSQKNWT